MLDEVLLYIFFSSNAATNLLVKSVPLSEVIIAGKLGFLRQI